MRRSWMVGLCLWCACFAACKERPLEARKSRREPAKGAARTTSAPPPAPPQPRAALPQLPEPAEEGAPAPAQPADGSSCGHVEVEGSKIPIDCLVPGYGDIPWAKVALMARSLFEPQRERVGDAELPEAVDHRADGTEGPVRSQGAVGACTAFSLASTIDHALARAGGRAGDVSVMHLWARYHAPNMGLAANGNRLGFVAEERALPYDPRTACSWMTAGRACGCSAHLGVGCGTAVPADYVGTADRESNVRITSITRLRDLGAAALEQVLAKGQDLWIAMGVGPGFHVARGPNPVIRSYDRATGGHALVLAGYKRQANGTYFLLHNSWGAKWGDGGYAWIHEKTLRQHLHSAYVVDARPRSAPVKTDEALKGCPAGQLPDSGSGRCAPRCPDGSARYDDVCAAASSCPRGYVSLLGRCVVAAPKRVGVDPKTAISYVCGAGGCTYVIPFGGACTSAACFYSCPAPQYLLTTSSDGFGCTE